MGVRAGRVLQVRAARPCWLTHLDIKRSFIETASDRRSRSPEGHALRFNGRGQLVGVTIINARWLLDRDGEIALTVPAPAEIHLAASELQDLLVTV